MTGINYIGGKKIRMEWEQIQVTLEMAEIPIVRGSGKSSLSILYPLFRYWEINKEEVTSFEATLTPIFNYKLEQGKYRVRKELPKWSNGEDTTPGEGVHEFKDHIEACYRYPRSTLQDLDLISLLEGGLFWYPRIHLGVPK